MYAKTNTVRKLIMVTVRYLGAMTGEFENMLAYATKYKYFMSSTTS